MTTMLLPPGSAVPAGETFRILTIAADLLPPEVVDARRGRRVRWLVITAVAVFVVLLTGWYAVVHYQTAVARGELVAAEAEEARLIQREEDFAELVRVRGEAQTINTQLAGLLADDLQWAKLLSSVRTAAPAEVTVEGMTAGLSERGNDGARTADDTALPNATGQELIGTLTVTGTGESKAAVAGYVAALGGVSGVGNPLLNDAREGEDGVEFTVRVDITSAALGGRYSAEPGKGK